MPSVEVNYHGDTDRPGIKVRDPHPGISYSYPDLEEALGEERTAEYTQAAYELVRSDFWAEAEQRALHAGLGNIEQGGRSGGWLLFEVDPRYLSADSGPLGRAEWLAGYAAMRDWAREWIADAPRKVRRTTEQIAMEEVGVGAARRFFAFDPFPFRVFEGRIA